MTIIEALLLGLIHGITEFIPVSSSGHMAIIENLLKISSEECLPFMILVHVATPAAVLAALRKEIKKIFIEFCRSAYDIYENIRIYSHNRHEKDARRYKKIISNNYRKLFLLLVTATLPAMVETALLWNMADLAGGNFLAPGMGLFITGIVLLVADFFPRGKKIPRDISYSTALVIGLIQGLTVFPGVSRLGITLAVCMGYGFQRKFAVKYTFLLSIPVLIESVILECLRLGGTSAGWQMWGGYAAGAAVSGIAAYFFIGKMLKVLMNKKLYGFSVYCFLIGAAAVAGNFLLV
ncbi:MAG TPA: undecaprenyl-diphosphate phosphatase [Candidatus Blautia merdigallinarum]|uniref:Undecaprenyl-diphosphatase n=1 Tax=Candidatus Blautia merdigallinarum TaxID=2838495 RepID=A0A9D2SJJ0_9FIRM|nr:undecaprenyl-diphosphate phosphatase [Candidatus Blautia merdigallinarum]